jgi:excisionase family DNA binding protein
MTALMKPEELAELLRVTVPTAWGWARRGTVPGVIRPGGRAIRFRRDLVEAWIAAGCPSPEEVNPESGGPDEAA